MRWAMATWTLMTWAMSGSRVVVHGNRRTHLLTPIVALSLRNANVPWHCQCGRWLPVAVWRHRVLRFTHRGQTSVQWLPVSGPGPGGHREPLVGNKQAHFVRGNVPCVRVRWRVVIMTPVLWLLGGAALLCVVGNTAAFAVIHDAAVSADGSTTASPAAAASHTHVPRLTWPTDVSELEQWRFVREVGKRKCRTTCCVAER